MNRTSGGYFNNIHINLVSLCQPPRRGRQVAKKCYLNNNNNNE